jgi:hypothetical protein
MWMNKARAWWELSVHMVFVVTCGAASVQAFRTGEVEWGLGVIASGAAWWGTIPLFLRCKRCGKSALWWAYRKLNAFRNDNPLASLAACPYCGYDAGMGSLFDSSRTT